MENLSLDYPKNSSDLKEWIISILHNRTSNAAITQEEEDSIEDVNYFKSESDDSSIATDRTLILQETSTIFLLSIPSYFHEEELPLPDKRAIQISMMSSESQTAKVSEKSKVTETIDVSQSNAFVNASAWDLYDAYSYLGEGMGEKEFQMLIDTTLKGKESVHLKFGVSSGSEYSGMPIEKQISRIVKLSNFEYNLLVTERLLASNNYRVKQTMLVKPTPGKYDPPEHSAFSYEIKIIWAYDRRYDEILSVTSLDWNPKNKSLLAVGYGKLQYGQSSHGVVCVWSPKNPSKPERTYQTEHSVTCLAFSKSRPNLLATALSNGEICLIDISLKKENFFFLPRENVPLYRGPIWKLVWCNIPKLSKNHSLEELYAIGEAGKFLKFSYADESLSSVLLCLEYTSKLGKSFTACSMAGLWFSIPEQTNFCHISTKEGVILKCILTTPCEIKTRLPAHLGPAYTVQHSPVTPAIFLSCGADNKLCIWIDGISEPLAELTLSQQEAMVCAQWSPVIPTLLVTLSTFEIAVWDIARKVNQPMSCIKIFGSEYTFTTLTFSSDGNNVVVGDQQGLVKVFKLTQLPRVPFLKVEALLTALRDILSKRLDILKKVDRIVNENPELFKTKFGV